MTPNEEFLVHVRIYEPFQSQPRSLRYRSINTLPVLKLKHVISIPGCQTLYELRRKIVCQSDLSIATEISESPNQKPGPMAKVIISLLVFACFYLCFLIKNNYIF